VQKIPLKNGYLDLSKTLEKINNKTSIIYIVNPNMPTGRSYSHAKIDEFISKVPKNILIVIDEAYIEFAVGIEKSFELDHNLIKKYDNLLITRTFSKMFALAGYRIGYMISSKRTVDLFKKAIQVFPLSRISVQFAYQALLDIPYYENIYLINKDEKKKYYAFFDRNKLDYFESAGNFIYINTKNETWKNAELRLFLLKNHKILIRNVLDVGLRITVGTPKQNALVQKGIKEFLDGQ
jgi:histidinol-phosphate aminotransferase